MIISISTSCKTSAISSGVKFFVLAKNFCRKLPSSVTKQTWIDFQVYTTLCIIDPKIDRYADLDVHVLRTHVEGIWM